MANGVVQGERLDCDSLAPTLIHGPYFVLRTTKGTLWRPRLRGMIADYSYESAKPNGYQKSLHTYRDGLFVSRRRSEISYGPNPPSNSLLQLKR